MNWSGPDQPALRVLPPDQGLHADGLACREVHDRLVVRAQLVALQGPAQAQLVVEAGCGLVVHGLVEVRRLVAPGALGAEHGRVGLAEQRLGARARGGGSDPDARGERDLVRGDRERCGDGLPDGLHEELELVVADRLADDGELVAAESGERVAGSDHLRQPLGHIDEQGITDAVTESVVDGLERVEVQEAGRPGARPGVWVRASPASIRSASRVRLGRPVSGSCRASCSRSWARRSRSWDICAVRWTASSGGSSKGQEHPRAFASGSRRRRPAATA